MYYLAEATTRAFRFGLTFLLLGAVAPAQTGTSQVPVSPVRAAPLPTLIVPGQNGAAVHSISTDGSGGSGMTDSVPGASGDVVVPRPLTPSGDRGFEILIGPGDLIEVSVYGAPDYIKDVRVGSTGEITLPLAGTVKVGGLTPAQAEAPDAFGVRHASQSHPEEVNGRSTGGGKGEAGLDNRAKGPQAFPCVTAQGGTELN